LNSPPHLKKLISIWLVGQVKVQIGNIIAMVYRAIGIMSGSSLDGIDIVLAELHENAGKWTYEIIKADCYAYSPQWVEKLRSSVHLNALNYQLLHVEYGHYIGTQVNRFIESNGLQFKVALIASHGHTSFHVP